MPARQALAALFAFALAVSMAVTAQEVTHGAQRLFLEGRYEAARVASLEAISANPADIEAAVILAWSLLALDRPADAEIYALKAWKLRNDPRLAEALGEAAFHLGHNESALTYLQQYVAAGSEGPRVGNAYYFMGEIYLRSARYGHADIAFGAAIRYAPTNARWWARLGWAREKSGDLSNALRAYEEALRLDPRLDDAILGFARTRAAIR